MNNDKDSLYYLYEALGNTESLTNDKVLASQLVNNTKQLDVVVNSGVDLVVDEDKTLFIDGLGNTVTAKKDEFGLNEYVVQNQLFQQTIGFQSGSPIGADGEPAVNGCSNEAVLATVLHRLKKQNENIPSPYNDMAILMIAGAISLLQNRFKTREEFGLYQGQKLPDDVDEAKLMNSLSLTVSTGHIMDILTRYSLLHNVKTGGAFLEHFDRVMKGVDKENTIVDALILHAIGFKANGIEQGISKLAESTIKAVGEGIKANNTGVKDA